MKGGQVKMNLDFHYYATCLAAVTVGYTLEEAQIIAYAAQLVDDNTIRTFSNKVSFQQIPTSRELDDIIHDAKDFTIAYTDKDEHEATEIWTELERLPIVSLDINPITYLPQHFSLDNEIIIGRTELSSIPKSAWSTLNDPKIRGGEAKQRLVSSYNMACIYYLKKMCEQSIAANTSKSKTISVTHRSMT